MPSPLICIEAENLIIQQEVSSAALYKAKYTHPTWPGNASGPTIGIGVDLGYTTHDELEHDWQEYLPARMIGTLHKAIAVRGDKAHILVRSGALAGVDVPWDAALHEFENMEIPKWVAKTNKAFPGLEKLGPLCEGAVVSLCFNRGTAVQEPAGQTRRLEMRNIKAHLANNEPQKIPAEFRSMKRLWTNGLCDRREHEAQLFELGLTQLGLL